MRIPEKSSLSQLRAEYDKGNFDRKIFEGLIFQYLIDNCKKYTMYNKHPDRWFDFVSWLYPRLSRAVDYYRESGSNFDTYINSIIHWSGKEYRAIEEHHRITEYICWKSKTMETKSNEPLYAEENKEEYRQNPLFPLALFTTRQVLILFLKSYYFIDEKILYMTSKATKIEKEHLRYMLDKIRGKRLERDIKINVYRENLYSQYHRCMAYQSRLYESFPETAKYYRLTNNLERARRRYNHMKERFSNIRFEATNRQISEVLNIPKGTVDSAIYNVKKKWERINRKP